MTKRFAIYYAPPEDAALSRLATAWLGHDAFNPSSCPMQEQPRNGFSHEIWDAVTSEPRLYGFHATLKPPFRLADGKHEQELLEQARAFSARRRAFSASPLRVSSLASFLALTLSEPCPALQLLAADCVREFDAFRASPTADELARRRSASLNPKHLEYLDRWGYPYVMEEWRFHMTLTSSLKPPLFESVGTHLKSLFAPHCREPFTVDSICLFEQPDLGQPFGVLERFRLA